jgi:hypothetical protein
MKDRIEAALGAETDHGRLNTAADQSQTENPDNGMDETAA